MSKDILKAAQKNIAKMGHAAAVNQQYAPVLLKHGFKFSIKRSAEQEVPSTDSWVRGRHEIIIHQGCGWDHMHDTKGLQSFGDDTVDSLERHLKNNFKLSENTDDLLKNVQNHLHTTDGLVAHKDFARVLKKHGFMFDHDLTSLMSDGNSDVWLHKHTDHEVTVHAGGEWHHAFDNHRMEHTGFGSDRLDDHLADWNLPESDDKMLLKAQDKLRKNNHLVAHKDYEKVLSHYGYKFFPEVSANHTGGNRVDVWYHPKDKHEVTVYEGGWHFLKHPSEESWEGDTHGGLGAFLHNWVHNYPPPGPPHTNESVEDDDSVLNAARKTIVKSIDFNDPKQSAGVGVMRVIANHKNVDADTLHELAVKTQPFKHKESETRAKIAENPNTRLDTLWMLRGDSSPEIRVRVAKHPNADSNLLKRMALDYHPGVVYAAKNNPNLK